MSIVFDEYNKIFSDFDYSGVDKDALQKHINYVAAFADLTDTPIAIYDNFINAPVYMSSCFSRFFGLRDETDSIHPDDYELVYKSTVIAMRYFFNPGNGSIKEHKLVRRYRAKINNEYVVLDEQLVPIELDSSGRVWLTLIIDCISASQSPPFRVEFKIVNHITGDVITPTDKYLDGERILTQRELEILRLVEKGMLSKEISHVLSISVHTVNTHRQRILEKLKVNTSIEAVKYAIAMGVL